MARILRWIVFAIRLVVILTLLALLGIGAFIAVFFVQLGQQAPEASAAARHADEQIRAGIVLGMSAEAVTAFLDSIGASSSVMHVSDQSARDITGAASWISATVDQRAISPGPLHFACNADIHIRVNFDDSGQVQKVDLYRICL
jgi:hypothetical protein